MPRPAPFIATLLAAASLAACGSSDDGSTPTGPGTQGGGSPSGPSSAQVSTCAADRSGFSALQASGVSCDTARRVMLAWKPQAPCAPSDGGSRASCSVLGFRCLSVAVGTSNGALAVSCSRPGRSLSFGYAR